MEDKILAIMQPYIFPYVGYFQLINKVDEFVFYDDVNFIKKGWINRNNILGANGPILFTIPLKNQSQNKLINEVEVNIDQNFLSKFYKTLEQSYKKAPFYDEASNIIKEVLEDRSTSLISEIAEKSVRIVSDYLKLDTKFYTSSMADQNQILKGQDRILAICKDFKADHYINPIGGIGLYDKNKFENSGVKLNFIKSIPIEYKQFKNPFVPYLSIIDMLMFLPKNDIKEQLSSFELV